MLKGYYFGYIGLSKYSIKIKMFFLFLFSFFNAATRQFYITPTAHIVFLLEGGVVR